MKKHLFFVLMAVVMVGMPSCVYHSTPSSCQFHTKTRDLVVNKSDWQFDSQRERFYVHFNVSDITRDIYDYGSWTINREYNHGTSNAYQVALPETSYLWENVDDGTGNISTVYYQQLIDYAVGQGWVEITLSISDYYYAAGWTPDAMHFLMQIQY